jgi:hypothetical protein
MIDVSQWPIKTVESFFSALPWQGLTATSEAAETVTVSVDYRLLSVQAFFSSIAWDGCVLDGEASFDSTQILSYQLPVGKFFNCFVWKGRPKIGVVPQISTRSANLPDLSLNDLSDLF